MFAESRARTEDLRLSWNWAHSVSANMNHTMIFPLQLAQYLWSPASSGWLQFKHSQRKERFQLELEK